jgi:hypothetical protein
MMIFLHFLQYDYFNHHYNPFNLSLLQICRSCRVSKFQKVYVFLRKTKMLFFSSCPWSGLGRNRLQEKWPVVRKNHQDIHDLFILAFDAFTLQRYCGLPTRKAETSCLRKFSSPAGSNSRASLALVCSSRTLQAS